MQSLEQMLNSSKLIVKGNDEIKCTFANNSRRYKIINDESKQIKVVDVVDGFSWGQGASVKGAVISALRCGVPLKEINFNGYYVPVKECIQAVK